LYEAVNSGNIEKTKNVIEKVENQDSLKHEYSTSQDSVEESRTSCNSDENNSEMKCSELVNNKEDIKCGEKMEKDNIEYQYSRDIFNLSFESYDGTVLHLASRLGQADIVKILLEAGGNPTVK
jgi:hypothetical protein